MVMVDRRQRAPERIRRWAATPEREPRKDMSFSLLLALTTTAAGIRPTHS